MKTFHQVVWHHTDLQDPCYHRTLVTTECSEVLTHEAAAAAIADLMGADSENVRVDSIRGTSHER